MDIQPEDDIERFIRIINSSDYLLAGYASPYSVVIDYLPNIFIDAATLYYEISENKVDTPLNNFPPSGATMVFSGYYKASIFIYTLFKCRRKFYFGN